MADLLTVYDDDQANSFIDCMICDKRIRGDTHYKIHVTTLQHLKKEEALVAQGQIPRQPELPDWTNIKQYLEYLNLDEPIIGLGTLVQIPDHVTDDGKAVLKYRCRMCFVEMDLYSMVAHIVGRKHRQKYLEVRRPDLVTWNDSAQKQPGLVAKAKAAVVEKQEGWGTPVALKRRQVSNIAEVRDQRLSAHRQPYPAQDFHKKTPENEEQHGRPYYTGDNYEQYDAIPKQSHLQEDQYQRPYKEADVGGRLMRDDHPKRGEGEMHTRPYADPGGSRLREDYEESLGRGQFSRGDRLVSLDVQEKVYHEGVPKNRFNDKDLRVHRPGGSEYQGEQMEGRRYGGYDDRKPVVNPMLMQGRGYQDEGRRGTVREMHKTSEMPGYPHMLDPRDPRAYSEGEVPAKKKKKSRFSDATAEEIAFAHMRHSSNSIHSEKPRGAPVRAPPQLPHNQFAGSGSASHVPKNENVLDIFNEIQIENMDDATFLKEKLCSVLKEFQAKKSGQGHTSQSVGDHRGPKQMDARRDAYDNVRDDPDGMYLDKRGFQEARRYEDDRRGYQEPRQYGDNPRAFRDARKDEEDPRNLRESRNYGDESNRFNSYSSDQQYADDPRDFQAGRLQENPQNLPERRCYDHDLREKEQHYEEYSRVEAPRSAQEARYYEDNYRGFGNADYGRSWEHQKGRSMDRYEDRGPEDVQRGFQEDSRLYVGAARSRSHQNERVPGEELYDPFNPSSSPPPEASAATSLDKIASTLLELVARR